MNTSLSLSVLSVLFVAALLACPPLATAEQVVYDSTQAVTSTWQGTNPGIIADRGVEMLLAGNERRLVLAEIGVTLQGVPGMIDLKAKVWANDGPGQQPGTLLWESPWLEDVSISGWYQLVPFDIPNVPVSDHITVTIAEKDCTTGASYGEPLASNAAIGTTLRNWTGTWPSTGSGNWTQLNWSEPVAMRITATPDPATLSLLALGGLLALRGRRSKSSPRTGATRF